MSIALARTTAFARLVMSPASLRCRKKRWPPESVAIWT